VLGVGAEVVVGDLGAEGSGNMGAEASSKGVVARRSRRSWREPYQREKKSNSSPGAPKNAFTRVIWRRGLENVAPPAPPWPLPVLPSRGVCRGAAH
jgi:hypothetical protein